MIVVDARLGVGRDGNAPERSQRAFLVSLQCEYLRPQIIFVKHQRSGPGLVSASVRSLSTSGARPGAPSNMSARPCADFAGSRERLPCATPSHRSLTPPCPPLPARSRLSSCSSRSRSRRCSPRSAAPPFRTGWALTSSQTMRSISPRRMTRARTDAIRSGHRVSLCKSADPGSNAPTSAAWDGGFVVFVDVNQNGRIDDRRAGSSGSTVTRHRGSPSPPTGRSTITCPT